MKYSLQLHRFLLIVGNARSGSTILGAALDAHPEVVIANESKESANFWRGVDGRAICEGILANAEDQAVSGRMSSGYKYQIGLAPSTKATIRVLGDKIWNPATLLLHGNHGLIRSLEERMGAPIVVINSVRNIFDTVTTMHRRSGATIVDRLRWFAAHCEAIAAIVERLPPDRFMHIHHENLVLHPEEEIKKCCRLLDLDYEVNHVTEVKKLLFKRPNMARNQVSWTANEISEAECIIDRFPWLSR
jgi:hypothetical protein